MKRYYNFIPTPSWRLYQRTFLQTDHCTFKFIVIPLSVLLEYRHRWFPASNIVPKHHLANAGRVKECEQCQNIPQLPFVFRITPSSNSSDISHVVNRSPPSWGVHDDIAIS